MEEKMVYLHWSLENQTYYASEEPSDYLISAEQYRYFAFMRGCYHAWMNGTRTKFIPHDFNKIYWDFYHETVTAAWRRQMVIKEKLWLEELERQRLIEEAKKEKKRGRK